MSIGQITLHRQGKLPSPSACTRHRYLGRIVHVGREGDGNRTGKPDGPPARIVPWGPLGWTKCHEALDHIAGNRGVGEAVFREQWNLSHERTSDGNTHPYCLLHFTWYLGHPWLRVRKGASYKDDRAGHPIAPGEAFRDYERELRRGQTQQQRKSKRSGQGKHSSKRARR